MAQKHLDAYLLIADEKQEEMLMEWTLPQLMSFTDKPILIGDIGLSDAAKKYISHKRIEIDPRDKLERGGWFYKPAMISVAYKHADRVLFVDNDIEIRSTLDPLFDMIEDGKLLMAEDWARKPMLNSGMIGVSRCELLSKWQEIIQDGGQQARGDQEILHLILQRFPKYRDQIKILPQEWHWQRLMVVNKVPGMKKAKAIHWTGPEGKQYIRENLWKE